MYCTFSNPPVQLYTTYLNWQSDHGCWSLFAFQLQKHLHFIKKTWGGSSSVHLKEEPWYPESVFAACWICNHAFVGKWKGLCAQALRLSDGANITQHVYTHSHSHTLTYLHANGSVLASTIAKIHRNQIAYSHYVVFLICWLWWLNPPQCHSNQVTCLWYQMNVINFETCQMFTIPADISHWSAIKEKRHITQVVCFDAGYTNNFPSTVARLSSWLWGNLMFCPFSKLPEIQSDPP